MIINNSRDFRVVMGIKEDLDYFIERLKEEKKQDYINVEDLEKARKRASEDLKKYKDEQMTKCEDLKEGNIIRIASSDGISYSQYDYYLIKKIGLSNLETDLISVTIGDYENSIKKISSHKIKKEEFILTYNKNYHKLITDINEWYDLEKHLKSLPVKS